MSHTGFVSTKKYWKFGRFFYIRSFFWGVLPVTGENTKRYQTHDQLTFGQLVVVMRHLYPVILGEYDL